MKNKIRLCQRVGEYIDELDSSMKTTERHISRCESALASYECDSEVEQSTIKAVQANLDNSVRLKGFLHNEIVGMVDYQDDNSPDSFLASASGWRRYIPEHNKGHGHWYDVDTQHEALSYTGATDRDFEFW